MFRKRNRTKSGTSGSDLDQSRSKRQRVVDSVKILLDVAKESADWFPPLKSALGGVNALIRHYEQFEDVQETAKNLELRLARFRQDITTTTIDGDPGETGRRKELASTLEEIEKQSQALLAKGGAARFVDKGEDSKEVVNLIERLREAITHYQISQQQAIYDQITNLTSSFGVLLNLHERSPSVKDRLDSIMARIARLCPKESEDVLQDDDGHERWTKLFDTLRVIGDKGAAIYDRISTQGYVECQDDILAVSRMAEDIRDALLEYQTIQQQAIYEQNCGLIDTVHLSVLNGCRRARGAAYKHGNRRGCLRGTRETVLDQIESWAKDFTESPVFWLNGLAGTGKSTIAQTVAERLFADGLLGASFFCSRNFQDRSDLHYIFPTLAFQLAHKYPEFRPHLVSLLQSDPDVVDESLYNQMERLIAKPLRSTGITTVIVIDALDECNDEEPSSAILSVLGRLVGRIPKAKFLITGRPEPRIKTGFRLPLLVDSTNVFVLHNVHPALINDDIRLFLKHGLSELARRRQLDGWPSDEHIDLLCHRAAGLFVYAVATVKFLDSKAQLPKRRLGVIAGLPECTDAEGKTRFNSTMTLDSLYTSILQTAFDEEGPETHSKVRSTIGAVILVSNPLPPSGIAELIGLDPEEVMLFLTLVHSLLIIDEDFNQPVKPFHKSFPDFITDPSRCADARFYISPKNLHLELAINCLRVMNEGLEQNLLSLPDYALNSEVEDLETRIDNRISIALRYACQSWYSHLTKTAGDVTGVAPNLRLFLEEKFLAWLEVLSVLGGARRAVVALEQVIPWLQEVARDEGLLEITKDYFLFVTTFFEPISVSAVHIYHSALELSPLTSIVRRSYYHRRHTPFPRVVAGAMDSWERIIYLPSDDTSNHSSTWSPCGRFVAAISGSSLQIRDALSSELVSTLGEDVSQDCRLVYSPDGRSLAHLSDALVLWDIQTGGAAKEIQYKSSDGSIVWSSDGKVIGMTQDSTVHLYDVTLGEIRSPGTLQSSDGLNIWAHDRSFRVMATGLDDNLFTIDIFDVGSDLTRIESFYIRVEDCRPWTGIFSPTSYRISLPVHDQLHLLDIRTSKCLLVLGGNEFEGSQAFSSDGNLFAAYPQSGVRIWRYDSDCYTPWRNIESCSWMFESPTLHFSPTSSSILARSGNFNQVHRLDDPPVVARPEALAILSPCGNYIATAPHWGHTITITKLHSQIASQFIDTDMGIGGLALTGNILLAFGVLRVAAWRLTKEGLVDGVSGDKRAGDDDSIWVPRPNVAFTHFTFEDEAVVFETSGRIHAYHTGTGEALEPAQTPPRDASYHWSQLSLGQHYPHYRAANQEARLPEDNWPGPLVGPEMAWVKDPEGKHRLWIPVEWRGYAGWIYDIKALWIHRVPLGAVIIMF